MKNKIDSILSTMKCLHQAYQLLSSVEHLAESTGKTPEQVMEIIAAKYLYNVDIDIKETLLSLGEHKNKTVIYYSMYLDLVRNSFVEVRKGTDSTIDNRYSLMLDIRMWLSDIYTIFDSETRLFSYAEFLNRKDEIVSKAKEALQGEVDGYLVNIENTLTPKYEYRNACKELSIDDSSLMKMQKAYSEYLIKTVDLFDDPVLKYQYYKYVPEETQEMLREYDAIITRSDIVDIVERYRTSEECDADDIFDLLSQRMASRSEEITLSERIKEMYWDVTIGESKEIRLANILDMPYELVAETIIKGKPDKELIDFIQENKSELKQTNAF